MPSSPVDLVLPAHNEGPGIARTIQELHDVVAVQHGIPLHFIVCEDGSTDDTVAIVEDLAKTLPILLISSQERKGYSRAVLDGLRAATNPVVGFVDSDGQCDPADFPTLYKELERCDVVVGYRNPRRDALYRKAMSGGFKLAYERLFPVRLRDPSCPFVLLHREDLDRILRGHPGLLTQGFWWEFNARVQNAGLSVHEVPVHHRVRAAGETKVYNPRRIPGIAVRHLRAMFELRRELRALPR